MKVLIVGGGIGGLTLASLLKKKGLNPLVIEKEKKWRGIGYILVLWSNGLKVLEEVGTAEEIRKKGLKMSKFILKDEMGNKLWETVFKNFGKKSEELVEIEREILHKSLRKANKNTKIMMGTYVTSLTQTGKGVDVTFNNKKRENFDIVIGADGINSSIRRFIQPEVKKDYSGQTFFMFWVPGKYSPSNNVEHYWGRGKFFAIFPSKNQKRALAYFSTLSKKHSVSQKDSSKFIKENFSDMGGVIPEILNNIPKSLKKMYHNDDNEIHDKKWRNGRVCLIGDSAHAMSSIPGMGAGMAMEDAFVLTEELMKSKDHEAAFYNFEKRRKKRVNWLLKKSRFLHFLISIKSPLYGLRNKSIKYLFGRLYFNQMRHFLEEKA